MRWISKSGVLVVIMSSVSFLQTGCVVCRPSVNNPVNVGASGQTIGKTLCSLLVGPHVARKANEGRFVSGGEAFRGVPYLGYIPKIGHAISTVLNNETSYEYEHERLLLSVARDQALMQTLDFVVKNNIVSQQQVAKTWKEVLRQDYVSFRAYENAYQHDYITSDEYRRGLQRLVRHFLIGVNKSPGIDPYNTGLLSVVIQSRSDCDKALLDGLAKTLSNYDYPDAELAEAAYRSGLVSEADRKLLQQASWARLTKTVSEWSGRSMLISETESTRQVAADDRKLAQLKPAVEAIQQRVLRSVK